MSRRRLVNSYFYVMYNNQRVKKGGTVTLPPFGAAGGTVSFTVHSTRAWTMGAKPSWITTNVEDGDKGVTTVSVTAAANTGDVRNGSTNVGPVHFLDNYHITFAYSQTDTPIEYRNLTVTPVAMQLNTSDLTNGKAIYAYIDEYVGGSFSRTIEVTSAATWASQDTSVAICEAVSNSEVIKPVYGSGYHPSARTTTVTASYLSSAATCNVSVAAEGRLEYVLVVNPTAATIDSNGSTSLTVTLEAYVDGVRDSSQDRTVTTSAGYAESSSLINVDNAGQVTGTGQITGGDAVITVTHSDAPGQSVGVTIHVNDATVEYRELYVDPTFMSLTTADTTNGKAIHAYAKKYVNGVYVENVEVTTGATWTSADNDVATCNSVSNGEVVKPNYDPSVYHPAANTIVTASYLGMQASCTVDVAAEGRVEHILVASPSAITMGYSDSVGLTATLLTYVDGVRDASMDRDVTTTSSYVVTAVSEIGIIRVGSDGVVSTSSGRSDATATVQVTHSDASNAVDVPINVLRRTEYLRILPATTSTTWNGSVQYEVARVLNDGGQELPLRITDASLLSFSLANGTVGQMSGFTFRAQNFYDNADEEISVTCTAGTYSGLQTRTPAKLAVRGRGYVLRFDVGATPSTIPYSGTSQLGASAVTVDPHLGGVVGWSAVTDVVWSEDSNILSISGETATGNNTGVTAAAVTVTGTSASLGKSGTTVITVESAPGSEYRLDIEAVPSTIPYSGTSQLHASAVTVIAGTIIDCHEATDAVWSENSTALSISNGVVTGSHTGSSPVTVAISAASAEIGVSAATNVTVEGRPVGGISINIDSPRNVTSAAGSCNYYVVWTYLKPGTTIVLSGSNLGSFSPSSISITDQNHTGGSVTVVGNYPINYEEESKNLYLYGTATTYYNETKTGNNYYWQAPDYPRYENLRYASGNNLTVTAISLADSAASNYIFLLEEKYKDGVHQGAINASRSCHYQLYSGTTELANFIIPAFSEWGGYSDDFLTITYDKTIDSFQFTSTNQTTEAKSYSLHAEDDNSHGGGRLEADLGITIAATVHVYSYDLVVTPTVATTQPYSAAQQFYATFRTYVDGNHEPSLDRDVTSHEFTTWSISNADGTFTVLDVNEGLAEWVNLSTGNTLPTVRVTASYIRHARSYSGHQEFGVSNLTSRTASLNVWPSTTSVTYNSAVDYTMELAIWHNNTRVYYEVYNRYSTGNGFYLSANTNQYVKSDNVTFTNRNTGSTIVSAILTGTYEEATPLYLPPNTEVTGTATASLLAPQLYSVTFICNQTADTVSYTVNGGGGGSNSNVSAWTINGFYDGDVISYTATKAGYTNSPVTGTATINGADLTISIDFGQEMTSAVTLHYAKATNDSTSYALSVVLKTTDTINPWSSQTSTMTTSSSDNVYKTVTFDVPFSQTGKSFRYEFTNRSLSIPYDWVSFTGTSIAPIEEDTLSDLSTSIGAFSLSDVTDAWLLYHTCYDTSYSGQITLNAEDASSDYSSLNIVADGDTLVSFAGEPGHDDATSAFTSSYNICSGAAGDKKVVTITGGILDQARYNNFNLAIYSSGGTLLHSGPASNLVGSVGGGINLSLAELNGSYWELST